MKYPRRFITAVLVAATMVLAGCATRTARVERTHVVEDFTIVDSSSSKELSPAQLAELRQAVINYLQEQGFTGHQVYYVKVEFPAADPAKEAQWAIVRIGRPATSTYTVVAAYPGPDDFYPFGYYGFSGGYGQYARYDYYDPFDYRYGNASRPYFPLTPRKHEPDGKPDNPAGTHTRWNNPPRNHPDEPRDGVTPPRPADPDHRTRNRDRDHNYDRTQSGNSVTPANVRDPGNTYTPAPASSYTPPASYSPAPAGPRNESSNPARNERVETPTNEK